MALLGVCQLVRSEKSSPNVRAEKERSSKQEQERLGILKEEWEKDKLRWTPTTHTLKKLDLHK